MKLRGEGLGRVILAHGLRTFVMNVVQVISAFLVSMILAHLLGPGGRGYYALVTLVASTVAMLFNPCIYASANFFLSTGQWTVDEALGTVLFSSKIAGGISALAAVLTLLVVAGNELTTHQDVVLVALAAMTWATVFSSSFNGLFYGSRRVAAVTNWKMVYSVLQLLVFSGLAIWTSSVVIYIAAFALVTVLDAVIMPLLFRYKCDMHPTTNTRLLRQMLKYGIPVYSSRICQYLGQRADMYIVFLLAGTTALGFYSLSVTLAEQLWIVPYSISLVMMPNIGKASDVVAAQTSALVGRMVFAAGLAFSALFAPCLPWGIPLLYGDAFSPSIWPLVLLLPGTLAVSIFMVVEPFFQSRGRPGIPFLITIAGLVANIVTSLILTPLWGIAGAAIGSTVAYALQLALVCVAFRRMTGMPLRQLLGLGLVLADGYRLVRGDRPTTVAPVGDSAG